MKELVYFLTSFEPFGILEHFEKYHKSCIFFCSRIPKWAKNSQEVKFDLLKTAQKPDSTAIFGFFGSFIEVFCLIKIISDTMYVTENCF